MQYLDKHFKSDLECIYREVGEFRDGKRGLEMGSEMPSMFH